MTLSLIELETLKKTGSQTGSVVVTRFQCCCTPFA